MGWVGCGLALLVTIYTASYGWWAWQKQYYWGAIGTWVVALLTIALPVFLLVR